MSQRFFITKNIDALEFDAISEWGYSKHKHNFFELTFIIKGSGRHVLNESVIDYHEGDIFFLTPNDEHEFIISEPTKFGILKFTEQLFLEKASFSSSKIWRKNIETVIFHSNIIPESIVNIQSDKVQLFGLYQLIRDELNNSLTFSRNVLTELFGALLIILSRNIKNSKVDSLNNVDTILTFIRQNVFNKEQVKIKTLAEEFNLSPNYIGIFIKKHVGISLQQYVIQTKINVAKQLLKQTNLNVGEIADKTGFVDISHFTKTFKKHTDLNPTEFRNS